MAISVNGNYNYMNSFFNTASSNKSKDSSMSFIADYSAVKNGSYAKLAKKYYASEAGRKSQSDAKSVKASNDAVKAGTNQAVDSAAKLMNASLYEKKEVKAADGTTKTDYDRSKILDHVKSFVEGYNNAVKEAGESVNNKVLQSGTRLVSQTKVYAGALARIGVNLQSDNTFEIDEDKFNDAHMTDIKSLFTGSTSFGKSAQERLYQMYTAADKNTAQAVTYNASAKYDVSVGSMFDSLF